MSSFVQIAVFLSINQLILKLVGGNPPTIIYLFIFCVGLILFLSGEYHKYKLELKILFVCFILTIPYLNRAFYLQMLVVFFVLYIVLLNWRKKIFISVILVLTTFFMIFIIENNAIGFIQGTPLERRIDETIAIFRYGVEEKTSISMIQRMYESKVIFERFSENPINYLFGFGFGPTLDMTNSLDNSVINSQLLGAGKTHNVHFLHIAILYRYGLIGCVLYLYLIYSLVKNIYICGLLSKKEGLTPNTFVRLFGNVYPLSLIVYSSTASAAFFIDPMIGFALALADNSLNNKFKARI